MNDQDAHVFIKSKWTFLIVSYNQKKYKIHVMFCQKKGGGWFRGLILNNSTCICVL